MRTRCVSRARWKVTSSVGWAFTLAALVCLTTATSSGSAEADTTVPDGSVASNAMPNPEIQINAEDWRDMATAMAGTGNQTGSAAGSANTGSGDQSSAHFSAAGWHDITNANLGSGTQVIASVDSNGRDRTSDSVRLQMNEGSEVLIPIGSNTPSQMNIHENSKLHVNANDWHEIETALAGSGAQSGSIGGNANTGSGRQENFTSDMSDWLDIVNANAGSGAQVVESSGSSGRNRQSDSLRLATPEGNSIKVSLSVLESSVSNNSVAVSGVNGSNDSSFVMEGGHQFSQLLGVNVIVIGTGSNASQNLNVSVVSSHSSEP